MQTPQVGDRCCADPFAEDEMLYGSITKMTDGLADTDIELEFGALFCGDIPTRKIDGVWVFDSF